ncbi:MAG: hypothetical protein KAS62_02855 [Candidatus Delongbacteria bacterium]|nr:hypothetical protein [Candidatus Delongbacteria bacterium]
MKVKLTIFVIILLGVYSLLEASLDRIEKQNDKVLLNRFIESSLSLGPISNISIGYGLNYDDNSARSVSFKVGTSTLPNSFGNSFLYGLYMRKAYLKNDNNFYYFDFGIDYLKIPDWHNIFSGVNEGEKNILFPNIAIGYGYKHDLKNGDSILLSSDIGIKLVLFNLNIAYCFKLRS